MDDTTALRALLLDLGGVLIIPHNSPQRQYWLDRLGREDEEFAKWLWNTPAAKAAMRGELSGDEFWHAIGAELGLSEEESDALHEAYFVGDSLNKAAVALAQQARAHGLRVGLLSNAYGDLDGLLSEHGVLDLFDVIINSSAVRLSKPDAAIYHLACSRLGVPPEQTLFIDDRQDNVEGARKAGLHALRYTGEQVIAQAARMLGLPWNEQ